MTLSEKVSYLKGLADGLNIDESKPENKILKYMIEVLDDMALSVMDTEDEIALIGEQLDEVDEDLAELEEFVYEDDECDCDCCDDDDLYEIECPACHETIFVDSEILEDEGMECPNCGEKLEFDIECDCCDDEE